MDIVSRNRFKLNQSIDAANLERLCRRQGPFAFQREGKIRELTNLTDLKGNTLEKELLNVFQSASPKDFKLYNNQSISRSGHRYHTGKGPNMRAIERQSLDIVRKQNDPLDEDYRPRSLFGSKDDLNSTMALPSIKPFLRKKAIEDAPLNPKDPRVIISQQSITQRYLTKNVF